MKSVVISLIFSLLTFFEVMGQSCKQVTISDTTQRKVIGKFINGCLKDRYFIGDKGVVVVTRYVNESNRPTWLIHALIDDSYKDNPPVEWAAFGQDIVLFYDARSRYDVVKTKPTPELLQCLEDAIGDRLYIRPPVRDRLVDVPSPDGKNNKRKARRVYSGNTNNTQVVTFEADGTVKVLQAI